MKVNVFVPESGTLLGASVVQFVNNDFRVGLYKHRIYWCSRSRGPRSQLLQSFITFEPRTLNPEPGIFEPNL